jgi:hypothetical protein
MDNWSGDAVPVLEPPVGWRSMDQVGRGIFGQDRKIIVGYNGILMSPCSFHQGFKANNIKTNQGFLTLGNHFKIGLLTIFEKSGSALHLIRPSNLRKPGEGWLFLII